MYYVNKLTKNCTSLVRKPIPSCNAKKDKGEGGEVLLVLLLYIFHALQDGIH